MCCEGQEIKNGCHSAFGLELAPCSTPSLSTARLRVGLPVRILGSEVGNKPTVQRPALSNPFVILALEKSKCSFRTDAAPAPFHRNRSIYKDLRWEASMLSRRRIVVVNVFLHLWLYLWAARQKPLLCQQITCQHFAIIRAKGPFLISQSRNFNIKFSSICSMCKAKTERILDWFPAWSHGDT